MVPAALLERNGELKLRQLVLTRPMCATITQSLRVKVEKNGRVMNVEVNE